MTSNIVNTLELVRSLVKDIESREQKPLIFVDLEGVNLSRNGVVAIMQILVSPHLVVRLIDVHTLQKEAFDVSASGGRSLRTILESKDYPKVFFDVRNDSDALYNHYQISLSGVIDLQLLEFASRSRQGRFLRGLAKCISEDGGLELVSLRNGKTPKMQATACLRQKEVAHVLVKYCVQDVLVLPKLLLVYAERLAPHMLAQIETEMLRRIALSRSPTFDGKGRHMAVGPSFNWAGSGYSNTVDFPLILIGSKDLAERCALREVAVAEADRTKLPGPMEAADVLDSVDNVATASTIDAVPPTLASLQIDGFSTKRRAVDEGSGSDGQENEFEQGGHLGSLGYGYASDEGSEKDFTACSSSDCGFCGHCDY